MLLVTLGPETLELRFEESGYGLSARRLWEHTELAQINVFRQAISARRELNDAAAFIDVVWFDGDAFSLAGLTLADLRAGRIPTNCVLRDDAVLLGLTEAEDGTVFVRAVAAHLDLCSIRQAMRNQHHQFLPSAHAGDVFGVPGGGRADRAGRCRAMARPEGGWGQIQDTSPRAYLVVF